MLHTRRMSDSIYNDVMTHFNPQAEILPSILATDLDGTLIPLPENHQNIADLQALSTLREAQNFGLIFATGRHFESVINVIESDGLPTPDWIICDVGSSIYHRTQNGFEPYQPYIEHLNQTTGAIDRQQIETLLADIEGLELQAPEHQQAFKISYQSSSETVETLVDHINETLAANQLPFDCMGSIDPFLNCGLLDVLPKDVTKAYALIWLSTHANFKPDAVIYSGDSGNDLAALISGFRAIVVANASTGLADKVKAQLASRQLEDRFYHASLKATSGVLQGCRHFGLFA